MVECISDALHINTKQINIKSTTDKGFGEAGKGKGIRVISIVTVEILEGSD